jgi:benzodiazapine receptor
MSSTPETARPTQPKLQWVNIANVVAYILNVAVTYGVGVSGLFPTNAELSDKYQTLVTPAGYAFSIWGIIFMSQLIWTIFQLLPAYRSKELVLKGVGYNYVAACLAQILWTIFFSAELIPLSLGAMVSILIPLIFIVKATSKIAESSSSTGLYWLLQFPFEIHAGWIMAATLVNMNVVFVAENYSVDIQVISAWISLASLAVVSLYYTYCQTWVIPCVLAWASFAIKVELSAPRDAIANAFSAETVTAIEFASGILAILVFVVALGTCVYHRLFSRATTTTTEGEEGEASDRYQEL